MRSSRKTLTEALRAARAQLPMLAAAVRLLHASASKWTTAWVATLVLQGLLPVAVVYLTRAIVNHLAAATAGRGGWQAAGPIFVLVVSMAGVMLLLEVLRAANRWIRTAQSELLRDYVSDLVQRKAVSLDLARFESPDYYDRLHRVRTDAHTRPVALLESGGAMLQSGITLIAMAGVLIPYGPWLPLALLLSTIPAFHATMTHVGREYRWRMRVTGLERRAWYYDWLLTGRDPAAELRLFDLGAHFRKQYESAREVLRDEQMRLARDQSVAELAASVMAMLVTGAAMAWMVWRALIGRATLGDLALFYQAFSQGQGLMRGLLSSAGQIYSNSLFLGNLFEFLALEPLIVDPPEPCAAPRLLRHGITFRDVRFAYPGAERRVLDGFDLTIAAGDVVAIVGQNGVGKSTLIKLLCRFYDPDAGVVELDGVDLRRMAQADLRRHITVLFQEPMRYSDTAAVNIALGDLDRAPPRDEIELAAHRAGADVPIARLPGGYEALLGKWFGGAELSVGEWQRLSLARAFLRRAPIIVLDEPTSAMDSWAEVDWMRRFRALAEGHTAIVITHRFTTAMRADVIHLMGDGRIVESGSHAELLALGGGYARSWASQMEVASERPVDRPRATRIGTGGR